MSRRGSERGLIELVPRLARNTFRPGLAGERFFHEFGEAVRLPLPDSLQFLHLLWQRGGEVLLFGAVGLQIVELPRLTSGAHELPIIDPHGAMPVV